MFKHNFTNYKLYVLALPLFIGTLSCSPKLNRTPDKSTTAVEIEEVNMPEIVIEPDAITDAVVLPVYRASVKRYFDLLHTKLDVSFDWEKQYVFGKANLTMTPIALPQSMVELDAKGFEIKSVVLEGSKNQLKYDYDGMKLKIYLGKTIPKGEDLKLAIEYIAKPSERSAFGGSSAITSDKGLFFINHDNSSPKKPQQIWTQGETENNSRWFPTFDTPNERCTQETIITIEDRFKTLSNGIMVSSTKNNNGTRTDYWKMDKPHAPYLFMIAAGEFVVVKDKWRDIELSYFVEPKYEKDAKAIFNHTPEMLEFFSNLVGVDYPWQKYAQVVVRDYVSGAMENTTAVIFGEFVQKTQKELIDNDNDLIVAHEMFHHWFGDYVTCESWSNLTLNEGFANYSEYLWFEHKRGRDVADFHLVQEKEGYFNSSKGNNRHDLIDFTYDDKEDMFDAHSYNKGGCILHMLRNYLGDELFFKGLKYYLQKNAFTDVEAHELRLAFEEVTGEDLNWFFNQWFFASGHPELKFEYDYDASSKKAKLTVKQLQEAKFDTPSIFKLPIEVDVFSKGNKTPERKRVWMTQREQTFTFDANEKPELIMVDPEGVLLAQISDVKSENEYLYQYENTKGFFSRYNAIMELKSSKNPMMKQIVKKALSDNAWSIRVEAVDMTDPSKNEDEATMLATMAKDDVHSMVRAEAISKLGTTKNVKYVPVAENLLQNDPTNRVVEAALKSLINLDKETALTYAEKLEKQNNTKLFSAIASIYSNYPNESRLTFFEKNFSEVDGFESVSLFANYRDMLRKLPNINVMEKLSNLYKIASDNNESPWRRYSAAKVINDMRSTFRSQSKSGKDEETKKNAAERVEALTKYIEELKKNETNEQIKTLLNGFQ